MPSEIKVVVVVDLPPLAQVLSGKGVFDDVVSSDSETDLQKALAASVALKNAEAEELLFLICAEATGASHLAQRLGRVGNQVVLIGHGPIGTEPIGTIVFEDGTTVNDVLPTLSRIPGVPYLLPDDAGEILLFSQEPVNSSTPEQATPEIPVDQIQPDLAQTTEPPPPGPFAPPSPTAPRSRGGKRRVRPSAPSDVTAVPTPPISIPDMSEPLVPSAPLSKLLSADMREGDSRDAPDWARNLEGEAEGQTPPESETSTEEEPDVSEPTLSPPNWAEESDWDKTTLSPHPPVTVVDTDHVDGPPEWLADVIDQTEPQARIPDKSYLDEFNEDGSEEKDAVAIDEETPWEELFEEVTADLDDSDLLGFSEDIPAPPGFENKPDPVWDVVTIVGDRPPPRRLVQGERIKVIAFTVPKGGTGKTATAAYGSWVLASVNKRVLYLDANSQQADGAGTFDMASTSPSIVDLAFRDETESHMPVTRDSVHHVLSNISGNKLMALFGPSDPRQANPLVITPQLYAEALDAVADEFDYVIIDSPIAESYRDIIDEFILARADFVACVVTPNWQTVTNTYKWLLTTTDPAYAGSRAYPSEQIGWFFNRYESDVDFDDESAEKTLQPWRFLGRIPDLKTVRRAANRGDMPMDLEYIKPLLSVFHEITHDESLGVLAEASEGKRKHFGWR